MGKKKILLFIASLFCLSLMAEGELTHLVVWAKDGTKVSYLLKESPKVTFTNTDLVIKTNEVEINYDLLQMQRFTYEDAENSGIVDVNGDKVDSFEFDGESLLFPALSDDLKVKIFNSDGKVVLVRHVGKGSTLAVSLGTLSKGVYIVKINGITYKILKR